MQNIICAACVTTRSSTNSKIKQIRTPNFTLAYSISIEVYYSSDIFLQMVYFVFIPWFCYQSIRRSIVMKERGERRAAYYTFGGDEVTITSKDTFLTAVLNLLTNSGAQESFLFSKVSFVHLVVLTFHNIR